MRDCRCIRRDDPRHHARDPGPGWELVAHHGMTPRHRVHIPAALPESGGHHLRYETGRTARPVKNDKQVRHPNTGGLRFLADSRVFHASHDDGTSRGAGPQPSIHRALDAIGPNSKMATHGAARASSLEAPNDTGSASSCLDAVVRRPSPMRGACDGVRLGHCGNLGHALMEPPVPRLLLTRRAVLHAGALTTAASYVAYSQVVPPEPKEESTPHDSGQAMEERRDGSLLFLFKQRVT